LGRLAKLSHVTPQATRQRRGQGAIVRGELRAGAASFEPVHDGVVLRVRQLRHRSKNRATMPLWPASLKSGHEAIGFGWWTKRSLVFFGSLQYPRANPPPPMEHQAQRAARGLATPLSSRGRQIWVHLGDEKKKRRGTQGRWCARRNVLASERSQGGTVLTRSRTITSLSSSSGALCALPHRWRTSG